MKKTIDEGRNEILAPISMGIIFCVIIVFVCASCYGYEIELSFFRYTISCFECFIYYNVGLPGKGVKMLSAFICV